MNAGRDQLEIDVLVAETAFERGRTFVVETMQLRFQAGGSQTCVNKLECSKNAGTGPTLHGFEEITIAIIVVND